MSNSTGRRQVNPNGPVQDRFGFTDGGIAVYDLDGDGNISNGRAFFRVDEISGDGMAMDTDGNVYMTGHNANPREPKGTVVVLDSDGRLLQEYPTACANVVNPTWIGCGADATSLYLMAASPWRLYRIKTVRRGHYFE